MRYLAVQLLSAVVLLPFAAACGSADAGPTDPETATGTMVATAERTASSEPAAAAPEPATTSEPVASVEATASAAAPAELPPLPKMKVLVIGDSFAQALGVGLKSKEAETGIKFVLRGEKATYIPEWAGSNRNVAGLMIQEKPDLVIVALGGNELEMTTPDIRAPKVKKLVGLLGSTPCVWVSPPLWGNKDNGLLGVIRDNSMPCRYFDSNVLSPDLPRGGDKIHPTSEGQKIWAGSFLDWLRKERAGATTPFALKSRSTTG